MKKLLFAILLWLAVTHGSAAQSFTTVTATVTDNSASATVYALGSYNVTLSNNSGQQALFGGNASFQQVFSGQSLSSTGTLTIVLPSVTQITPLGIQWTFRICANPAQIAVVFPPVALPCFTYTTTGTQVSGASVDISTSLKAVAATIPTVGSGSGFPITSPQTVASGGSIIPTGTGFIDTVALNSPLSLSQSGPGPVFNVANYPGAFHNSRQISNCTPSASQISCPSPSGLFTAADVGLRAQCSFQGGTTQLAIGSTISSITSATVAQLSAVTTGGNVCTLTIGTPDDAAIAAAYAAALAQSQGGTGQGQGNRQVQTAAPVLYFPGGGWMACATGGNPVFNFSVGKKGFKILGDTFESTNLYNCDNSPTMTGFGYWVSNTNMTGLIIENINFNGGFIPVATGGFGYALYNTSSMILRNVHISQGGWGGGVFTQANINAINWIVDTQNGTGVNCNGCTGDWREWSVSNSASGFRNILIQNVTDSNINNGLHLWGGLGDECGGSDCFRVVNSQGLWLHGVSLFGTGSGSCFQQDGTSFVHWEGGLCGTFGNDGNNSGPTILAGGVLQATDLRSIATGTGKCINNSGSFFDNGGNSCETMYQIVSGTSTTTTAVLTLNANGTNVNTNCSVGDALFVEGAGIPGYNGYYPSGAGITAVTATTLTYTTAGSNLGALGAGGVVSCRNLQQYSGNLPKALLNNPIPNTCYVTGTFGATVTGAPMCAFKLQSFTNVTNVKASSTTVTACSVAPVVTISDGIGTITLTITTAKSLWDSSVDVSSGVGTTIFKPYGQAAPVGTIQVTNTSGTCTTPPTNFSVSYNISPILSN
jgi:hypothetical protein